MSGHLSRNHAALETAQPFDAHWIARSEDDRRDVDTLAGLSVQSTAEVTRWLNDAIGASTPTHLVVVGATQPETLRLIFHRAPETRLMLIEPNAESLRTLLSEADWSEAIERGRLSVVGAQARRMAQKAWLHFDSARPAPLLVNPRIARRAPKHAATARGIYSAIRMDSTADSRLPSVRQSMLHDTVLVMLEQAASVVRGGVVEIGAYVGGSTAALCRGLRSTGHRMPFVSIEPGGSYPGHPHLPSDDIFRDLTSFIAAEGLDDRVVMLNGYSSDTGIQAEVARVLAGNAIGLLLIDADGAVLRDFTCYLPFTRVGALIVVDDYRSALAPEKAVLTKSCIDTCVSIGLLEPIGVFGWGTWFGTLEASVAREDLEAVGRAMAA